MTIILITMLFIFGGILILTLPTYFEMSGNLILTAQQNLLLNLLGILLLIAPTFLILILAKKSSAIYLIDFPKRGQVLWLYILKGGYAYFVPSVRLAQAHLWSKGKGIVKDIGGRSRITIRRHDVRIVLETVGHTIDPYMAHYTSILRRKYGLKNFIQARHAGRFIEQGYVTEKDLMKEATKQTGYTDQEDFTDEEVNKLLGLVVGGVEDGKKKR